ncbi:MAG TPA: SAM-dependent methyltransferase, partial [Paludibacteraceae bacterium]|nr:SAM-dependent methyltransferase [Paludibacteraceae bacterium]
MMDLEIGVETKRFIAEHVKDDVRNLALHPGRAEGVDLPFALSQIEGRQIARRKLPSLAQVEGIL